MLSLKIKFLWHILAIPTDCLNWFWLLKFSEGLLFSETFISLIKAVIKWPFKACCLSEFTHEIRNLSFGFHWLSNVCTKWFQVIYNTCDPSFKVWFTYKGLSLNYESINKTLKKGFFIKLTKLHQREFSSLPSFL